MHVVRQRVEHEVQLLLLIAKLMCRFIVIYLSDKTDNDNRGLYSVHWSSAVETVPLLSCAPHIDCPHSVHPLLLLLHCSVALNCDLLQ